MAPVPVRTRTRADRCPGVLRPWPAEDGLLVRVRLVGGRLPTAQLRSLVAVAERHGDGVIRPTSRANVQLRAMPDDGTGHLTPAADRDLRATGLVPSAAHDLVRNILVSPLTGLEGGRADLRALAAELDREICASPALAGLPGKFLFVLDDGRGDLLAHPCDLGLVALDGQTAQLRIGEAFGPVVPLADAVPRLLEVAHRFLAMRGDDETAAWHVHELTAPVAPPEPPDPRLPDPAPALPFGAGQGWEHIELGPDGVRGSELVRMMGDRAEAVFTPWYGLVLTAAQGGAR